VSFEQQELAERGADRALVVGYEDLRHVRPRFTGPRLYPKRAVER
jgi:hypothetical protein